MDGLILDHDTHTYTHNGKVVPSVSEIMRPLHDMTWKNIFPHILEAAAYRGTRVHSAIELYNTTGYVDGDEEIAPYLTAYKQFREDHPELTLVHSELMLTNGEYAGTIDEVYDTTLGYPIIVDIKTSSVLQKGLIAVQLAAYGILTRHEFKVLPDCYVLHLKKNGKYKYEEIYPDVKIWNYCLAIHNFNPKGGKK